MASGPPASKGSSVLSYLFNRRLDIHPATNNLHASLMSYAALVQFNRVKYRWAVILGLVDGRREAHPHQTGWERLQG